MAAGSVGAGRAAGGPGDKLRSYLVSRPFSRDTGDLGRWAGDGIVTRGPGGKWMLTTDIGESQLWVSDTV